MSEKGTEATEKLREIGYAFNNDGKLCKYDKNLNLILDEPYQFDVFDDVEKNEMHYQEVAKQIEHIVYDLLEQQGLRKVYIPVELPPGEGTFIFSKPEKLVNSKKLLVLIHGSGYVRAGQWARTLIINQSLDHGSQIPYVKKALSLGYDILITNTNDISRVVDGKPQPIPGLDKPQAHADYVFKKYVVDTDPDSVAIVAHSFGGPITMKLATQFPDFFKEKVFAVAFTDSSHFGANKEVLSVMKEVTCNWISSKEPLDKPMPTRTYDFMSVSAGHIKHEWTSYTSMESVFKFLESKYEKFLTGKSDSKKPKLDNEKVPTEES